MTRTCADCKRQSDLIERGSVIAAGGMCMPTPIFFDVPEEEKWWCPSCAAKYPKPVEYETKCIQCDGTGALRVSHSCTHCDHDCVTEEMCENCDGEGAHLTHDCNPGCDHSFAKMLSEVKVTRGGIKFS